MNIEPKEGETIVVWFSCGAASAVAAKMTIEKYGKKNKILVVNNYIKEEDEDNQRFLKDVEKWLGITIQRAVNSKYKSCSIEEVFDDRRYMSGVKGAPCTLELKKKARYEWEIKNRPDWTVMGFTKEERTRFEDFKLNERPASIWILENTSKGECFEIIKKAGIRLPLMYLLDYPNANCPGCVKASSPTYWNHVRIVHPLVFKSRANQSREFGVKLARVHCKYLPFAIKVDGIFYDRYTKEMLSTINDKGKISHSVRVQLDDLPENAKGRPMKSMKIECSIFCSTDSR